MHIWTFTFVCVVFISRKTNMPKHKQRTWVTAILYDIIWMVIWHIILLGISHSTRINYKWEKWKWKRKSKYLFYWMPSSLVWAISGLVNYGHNCRPLLNLLLSFFSLSSPSPPPSLWVLSAQLSRKSYALSAYAIVEEIFMACESSVNIYTIRFVASWNRA